MRDHDDGLLVDLIEFLEDFQDVLGAFAIEVPDRFVGKDDIRIIDERSGDGDALFLSAGKLIREFVRLFGDTESTKELVPDFTPFFRGFAAEYFRKYDVVDDIERGNEVEGLEYHTDGGLMEFELFFFTHLCDRFSFDADAAVGRGLQSGERVEESRFPAAGRPENDHVLVRIDGQAGFFERA